MESRFRPMERTEKTPCVLRGLDMGPCGELWKDVGYWKERIGDQKASVHVALTQLMSFVDRNFSFRVVPFGDMIEHVFGPKNEEIYYFRSIGDNPRKQVSNIQKSYPGVAGDFRIPALCQEAIGDRIFSSALRISSANCRLWTHYDVMDNFLFNIVGRKLVTLFPPEQAANLYPIGSSSPVLDIDNPDLTKFPRFATAQQAAIQFVLEPGDILFLPALWWHNVLALEPCISVNLFYRDCQLAKELYPPKDLYGNKDLLPALSGFRHIESALKDLAALPPSYQRFYRSYFAGLIEGSATFQG